MKHKSNYFIESLKNNLHHRRAWILMAFSVIQEDPDNWRKDPFPYRLVTTPTARFYVSPDNTETLIAIDETVDGVNTFDANKPLFKINELVDVRKGDLPNIEKDLRTTYNLMLLNATTVVYGFGNKIPYYNRRHMPGEVERIIEAKLSDLPPNGVRDPGKIYHDELQRFNEGCLYLTGLMEIMVPGVTEKALIEPPFMKDLREKLQTKYKDQLHDPAIIAVIDKELINAYKEWMGNDRAMDVLISKKSINIVRKKIFMQIGGEVGFGDGSTMDLIRTPLVYGIQPQDLPALNNSARAGSFFRGTETMLGGELFKFLSRATQNFSIGVHDCGTKLGLTEHITPENKASLLGFSIFGSNVSKDGKPVKLTSENYDSYLGKVVKRRSLQYCNGTGSGDEVCAVCAGSRLEENPTAISAAISNDGTLILYIFMGGAHAKEVNVERLVLKEQMF